MRRRFLFFILIFMLLFTNYAFADGLNQAQQLFYQGNANYSQESFEEAIADYEGALTLGLESGALYYNLANTYFKHGALGKTILNYLRAERLIPEDADLTSNLEYAQSLIKGGKVDHKRNWFKRTFYSLANSFSLDRISLVTSLLYVSLSILIILIILVRKLRRSFIFTGGPILVALLLCFSIFLVQFYQNIIFSRGVVVSSEAEFKFEPLDSATTFFSLSEGEDVIVAQTKGEWVKAKRADGKQGWVRQSDIELL